MGLTRTEREILDLWKSGESYKAILLKGYRVKTVNKTIGRYVRRNAKKWLIRGN